MSSFIQYLVFLVPEKDLVRTHQFFSDILLIMLQMWKNSITNIAKDVFVCASFIELLFKDI